MANHVFMGGYRVPRVRKTVSEQAEVVFAAEQVLTIHPSSTHAQAREMLSLALVVIKTRSQVLRTHGLTSYKELSKVQAMSHVLVVFGPMRLIEPMPQLRHLDERGAGLLAMMREIKQRGEAVNVSVSMLKSTQREKETSHE